MSLTTPKSHPTLILDADPIDLTAQLIDIPSPSHYEADLADAIERALQGQVHSGLGRQVEITRLGNTVLARTLRDLPTRVILAGHIDTVPAAGNLPHSRGRDAEGRDTLFGLGSVDMKSGDAVLLQAFVTLANSPALTRDMTLVMYEGEEVAAEFNGLGAVARELPLWLEADLAILAEPSGGIVEAGCQGSLRVTLTAHGRRAHTARAWLGDNAVHRLAGVLGRIAAHRPRRVVVDGCEYREGLQVVAVSAGVATNTVPDEVALTVNLRFAPDRSLDEARQFLLEVLDIGAELDAGTLTLHVDDAVPGARPGLDRPAAAELVQAVGGQFRAKYGWTDVARFAALGMAAVNFGPGDPSYCHRPDEQCPVEMISQTSASLHRYLTS